jgi:hypothetical protein
MCYISYLFLIRMEWRDEKSHVVCCQHHSSVAGVPAPAKSNSDRALESIKVYMHTILRLEWSDLSLYGA